MTKTAHELIEECEPCDIDKVHEAQIERNREKAERAETWLFVGKKRKHAQQK